MNPDAHDAYLKGRYFFNRPSDQNLQKAIGQYRGSRQVESGLFTGVLWNVGRLPLGRLQRRLSHRHRREGKSQADRREGGQLDGRSAEAHTSLAVFKLFYEFDWPGCEREFRQAIALNPNYSFAHDQFGMALAFQGRFEEAIAEGAKATELDPLSPQILVDATLPFIFRRNSAEAKRLARKAAELDPSYFFPVMIDGWADLDAGQFSGAIPALEKAKAMEAPPFVSAFLAFAYGAAGKRVHALIELANLKKMSADGTVQPFNMALVDLGLGDRSGALDNLERARAADSQMMAWIGRDTIFDPIRSEPRFVALLKKMGFN